MTRMKRLVQGVSAVALVLGLAACGGSTTPTQSCPTGTTGTFPNCQTIVTETCRQTVVESGNGPANPSSLYVNDFSVPDSGRLDVTVDWTNASSPIGFYLTPANTCTLDEFNARSCNFLVRSEPSAVKPRKLSTANFNAGNYRWLIANFGNNDESVAFQIVLSKGPCAALTASPGVGGTGSGPSFRALGPLLGEGLKR